MSTQNTDTPEPWGHKLWKHLHEEHGLTLVESEMHQIVALAIPLMPCLSAVEVHSKETMDEARELLGDFLDRVKQAGNRKETELIESALAKLNPQKE